MYLQFSRYNMVREIGHGTPCGMDCDVEPYKGAVNMKRTRIGFIAILCFALLLGCRTADLRNTQLESVAKDWALVIRASQVIPVYPLTEDLQPGDVLLVSTPIENQVKLYKNKGFLPLDQHLVRLYSPNFKEFYNSRYGIVSDIIPPAQWQFPNSTGEIHNWKVAPRAAFPTYQFSVNTGKGLNLAIPIQGVPLALGLMNSGKASGTVTIAEAFTFGLDHFNLVNLLTEWANKNRLMLRNYSPVKGKYHFLRVVSRVYMTGRVGVMINNDEATGSELQGGADRPLDLMGIKPGATEENFTNALKAIDSLNSTPLPGGQIKIVTASSRSVTLAETFERPLVLGYVGFDMPILEGGRLGSPISTLAQLNERPTIPSQADNNIYRIAGLAHMYRGLKEMKTSESIRVRAKLDALDRIVPGEYPFSLYEFSSPAKTEICKDSEIVSGAKVQGKDFPKITDFLGNGLATIETLEIYLSNARPMQNDQQNSRAELEGELKAARESVQRIGKKLNREPAVMEALDLLFLVN